MPAWWGTELFLKYDSSMVEHDEYSPKFSVLDPRFPRRGVNLLFDIIFAENRMKMKKINGGGGRIPAHPQIHHWLYNLITHLVCQTQTICLEIIFSVKPRTYKWQFAWTLMQLE